MPHIWRPRLTGRIDGRILHARLQKPKSDIGNLHPVKRPVQKNLYRVSAKL